MHMNYARALRRFFVSPEWAVDWGLYGYMSGSDAAEDSDET